MEEKVLQFIDKFRNVGNNPDAIIINFTTGNCYWFAHILYNRFEHNVTYSNIEIMYNQIEGHFACRVNENLYDITGKIPDNEIKDYISWMALQYTDPALYRKICWDCVLQEDR